MKDINCIYNKLIRACRHHQHGRWQARIGRVAGNKDLYLGTFSMFYFYFSSSAFCLFLFHANLPYNADKNSATFTPPPLAILKI